MKIYWGVNNQSVSARYAEEARPPWVAGDIACFYWPDTLGPFPTPEDFLLDPSRVTDELVRAATTYIPPGYSGIICNDATEGWALRSSFWPSPTVCGVPVGQVLHAAHALLLCQLRRIWPKAKFGLFGEPIVLPGDLVNVAARAMAEAGITQAKPTLDLYDVLLPQMYPDGPDVETDALFDTVAAGAFLVWDRAKLIIPVVPARYPNGSAVVTPKHYRSACFSTRATGLNKIGIWAAVATPEQAAEAARQAAVLRDALAAAVGGAA